MFNFRFLANNIVESSHETHLPTFCCAPQAHPWLSRSNEDTRRPRRDPRAPCEGSPAARGLERSGGAGAIPSLPAMIPQGNSVLAVVPGAQTCVRISRLTGGGDFAAVLKERPIARNERFAVHVRIRQEPGVLRLGFVVPRRLAPRAVDRNAIRRVWREALRTRGAVVAGPGCDIVVRLRAAPTLPAKRNLKRCCGEDARTLVIRLSLRTQVEPIEP